MSKRVRLITIELDMDTVQKLKTAVKAAKNRGVYMTQPLYCKKVILDHFTPILDEEE